MALHAIKGLGTGRKRQANHDEIDLAWLDAQYPKNDYRRIVAFIEHYLKVPKGKNALKSVKLLKFQKDILKSIYPVSKQPRFGLTLIPRGNGKSSLAAMVALYGLFNLGEMAEIICTAVDLRQAGIVMASAVRMLELSPELNDHCTVYQDKIVYHATNSTMFPVPSDERQLQGWSPSLVVCDEAAFVNPDGIEALFGAAGKREKSLCWLISTPPLADDNFMYSLVNRAKLDPKTWAVTIFTSDPRKPADDRAEWKRSNPALGTFLALDGLEASYKTMRESTFRRVRLGQFIAGAEDAWLEREQWDSIEDPHGIPDGVKVILGFDGSYSGDTTALVAVTVSPRPHIELVKVWDPGEHRAGYRVPVTGVEQAIRDACKRWQVVEVVCDPSRWQRTLDVLAGEGLPMVEFPQTPARMSPATLSLYDAIVAQNVTQSGDPVLTRHALNARVAEGSNGSSLKKDNPKSEKRIDAIVCAVMAHSRAVFHASRSKSKVRSFKAV